eukprot:1176623-Prorocentrum_minimum.AAC.2
MFHRNGSYKLDTDAEKSRGSLATCRCFSPGPCAWPAAYLSGCCLLTVLLESRRSSECSECSESVPLIGRPVPLIGRPVPLIGRPAPLIGRPVPLIGRPVRVRPSHWCTQLMKMIPDVFEGSLVRAMRRLEELTRQVTYK